MLQTIIMPPQWVWISFPLVCATDSAVLYATSIYILFLFLRWSPVTMEWNTSEGNVANGMHRQKFPKKIGIRDTRSIKVPQPFLVSTRRKLSLQILGGWGTTSRGHHQHQGLSPKSQWTAQTLRADQGIHACSQEMAIGAARSTRHASSQA